MLAAFALVPPSGLVRGPGNGSGGDAAAAAAAAAAYIGLHTARRGTYKLNCINTVTLNSSITQHS